MTELSYDRPAENVAERQARAYGVSLRSTVQIDFLALSREKKSVRGETARTRTD
jgi:hypothetical protein